MDVTDDANEREGKLELHGQFGSEQGSVELDGRPTSIDSWTAEKVVVRTPFSGPGAGGDLIVKAPEKVESNPVPITEWFGNVKLTLDPPKGSLVATADMDMRFRADVHAYRSAIDADPTERSIDVYVSPGSEGEVRASGQHSEGGVTVQWTGGGSMSV